MLSLDNSPATEFYMPTFQKTLHRQVAMKMEQTGCSETSVYEIQTPGNYPEESIQNFVKLRNLKVTSCSTEGNVADLHFISCLVCNCCWLAVCIVVVGLCVCSYLMCICCTMCVLPFLL